jgi:hypothetical protein
MARRLPETTDTSVESRVAASWLEQAEKVARRIAQADGDPPGAKKVGDAEAVRLWGLTDPNADYDLILDALATTGLSPEFLDPASPQALAVVKDRPELAPLYGQPAPTPELARALATYAEYPFRFGLFADFSDDPEEQVRRSDHLDGLWQKQAGIGAQPPAEGIEQAQPPMMPPAPGMPTPMGAPPMPAPDPMQSMQQQPPPMAGMSMEGMG